MQQTLHPQRDLVQAQLIRWWLGWGRVLPGAAVSAVPQGMTVAVAQCPTAKSAAICRRGQRGCAAAIQGAAGSAPGAVAATAGYGGGGATAFPAEAAGTVLPGEHLSDFEGKVNHSSHLADARQQWRWRKVCRGTAECVTADCAGCTVCKLRTVLSTAKRCERCCPVKGRFVCCYGQYSAHPMVVFST